MPPKFTRRQFLRSSVILGVGLALPALQETVPALTGAIQYVHDPVIIKADSGYYVFSTGRNIPVRHSPDLVNWSFSTPSSVFSRVPDWAHEAIPGQTDMWAPDIAYFNDKYHLYYSFSTFGSNRSVIGLATNTTLDPDADDFEWVDHGLVTETTSGMNYNAIDPNFVLDTDGNPWLALGSHWSGIKLHRLDPATGMLSTEDERLYSLARRSVNNGSVEGPFIIHRDDFYYLFVSHDACCQGSNSTYHVMVGRAEAITGPYFDRDAVDMRFGGGTQVRFPTERWRGPGHNAILREDDVDTIVYHAYDAERGGIPTLRIDPLVWGMDGWPSIVGQG